MGMRFRRSKKIAPGVRLNVSKGGVGLSFGGKGARYSVHSSGRKTTSVGIPGSGVSYVSSKGGGKKRAAAGAVAAGAAVGYAATRPKKPAIIPVTNLADTPTKKITYIFLVVFLGWLGVHYFISHRKGMGILYLCTVGLLGIGWIVDIVRFCMVKPGN